MATESPPAYTAINESTIDLNETEKTALSPNEDSENCEISFEKKSSQIAFIQKVLSVKLLQLLAVTIVIVIFKLDSYPVYQMMAYNCINMTVLSTLVLVATTGALYYCSKARLEPPFNYMLLVAFPLSFGLFVSVVTYDWILTRVMVSWIYFDIIVFALLLYSILALETKIEFKTSIGLYITAGILIVAFVLTVPFMHHISSALIIFHCSLVLFFLTAYMLSDLQTMISNDYRIHLTPGDFVKAAVLMHIDYCYIFTRIHNKDKRSNPA